MRDTWAAYLVDIASGKIEWTLGGNDSSYKFAPGAAFEWQHDVVLQPDSTVSVFDDHCCRLTGGGTSVDPTGPSRGLVLKLDQQAHRATLVAQYGERGDFRSNTWATRSRRPNGNVFVGWGSEPYFSEYDKAGKLLFEGELPGPNLSYRATLEPWVGEPLSAPAGAARAVGRQDDRLRELERRHARGLLARARRLGLGVARARRRAREGGLRDGDRSAAELPQLQAAGARREGARDRHLAAVRAARISAMTSPPSPFDDALRRA